MRNIQMNRNKQIPFIPPIPGTPVLCTDGMTAEGMFKGLGYHQKITDVSIEYYKVLNKYFTTGISFAIHLKYFINWQFNKDNKEFPSLINIEEHKAITKQMKELGWL